jgi:hypothetical protein
MESTVLTARTTWCRGEQLASARAAFEERGYPAHTPTLRHHELPSHEGATKIASLSLRAPGGGHLKCDPTFEHFRRWIANAQTEDIAPEIYDGLVCDSGRHVGEMFLAPPKLSKAAVVDFAAVTIPVLVSPRYP